MQIYLATYHNGFESILKELFLLKVLILNYVFPVVSTLIIATQILYKNGNFEFVLILDNI